MGETQEFSITRASQLTIPNKDWTHYRMGLKLRCTSSRPSGVRLEVVSQGRCIDSTYLTPTNVKFLVKNPVVGLKIFDGDTLNKRLQITFDTEAHYNFFSNKIQQWIGISLGSKNYTYADSQQAEPTQDLSNRDTGIFAKSSQIASQDMSQNYVQDTNSQMSSQLFMTQDSISGGRELPSGQAATAELQTQPPNVQSNNKDDSSIHNAFRFLLDASRMSAANSYDTSALSQSTDVFTNNTQYNTYSKSGLFLPNTESTMNTTVSSNPSFSRAQLKDSLADIPFETSQKKRSKSSRSKRDSSMDRILEKTLAHILKEKKRTLLTLDDEELSVRVARKLRSKSFLKLLKRIENIISN